LGILGVARGTNFGPNFLSTPNLRENNKKFQDLGCCKKKEGVEHENFLCFSRKLGNYFKSKILTSSKR
jgi:hypothetical protein